MHATCPNCLRRMSIDDSAIPARALIYACPGCGTVIDIAAVDRSAEMMNAIATEAASAEPLPRPIAQLPATQQIIRQLTRGAVVVYLAIISAWLVYAQMFSRDSHFVLLLILTLIVIAAGLVLEYRYSHRVAADEFVRQDGRVILPGEQYGKTKADDHVRLRPDMARICHEHPGVHPPRFVHVCWEPDRKNLGMYANYTNREKFVKDIEDLLCVDERPDLQKFGRHFGVVFTDITFPPKPMNEPPEATRKKSGSERLEDVFQRIMKEAETIAKGLEAAEKFIKDNPNMFPTEEDKRNFRARFRAAANASSANHR